MGTNKIKQPQAFEYLGKTFTPVKTSGYNWMKLSSKIWGNLREEKLECINLAYTHEKFYEEANKNGCGKIDVFEMDGEQVIPCNTLRYYGQPSWYKLQVEKEEEQPKTTQGSWQVKEQGEANQYIIIDEKNKWVFALQQNGEILIERQRANAQLIAAAPRLLKTLQQLAKEINLSKLNVKKDFELLVAHAEATKLIHEINN